MDDPWNWTVEDLVHCFCRDRQIWSDRPSLKLPESAPLEATLRDHDVDGATLLLHGDSNSISQFLQIKKWGELSAILYGIEKLRAQSSQWHTHRAAKEASEDRIRRLVPPTAMQGVIAQPITPPMENRLVPPTLPVAASLTTPKARSGETTVLLDKRKRRRLVSGDSNIVKRHKNLHGPLAFLGRTREDVEELFFASPNAPDEDSEEEMIIENELLCPPGRRDFVGRRVRHFLLSSPVNHTRSKSVIYPYTERLVKAGNTLQVALFHAKDGKVEVSKRPAMLLEADVDENVINSPPGNWDFLSKWAKGSADDTVLPLYEESGSENDLNQSLLDEMEEERNEDQIRTRRIPLETVVIVIDVAIAEFVANWKEQRTLIRERQAWAIWNKGRRKHGRGIVAMARSELRHLENRLEKLKVGIQDEEWYSQKTLEKQCVILQTTVESIEDMEWKLGVWRSPEPQRVKSLKLVSKERPKQNADESGDEIGQDESDADWIEHDSSPSPELAASPVAPTRTTVVQTNARQSPETFNPDGIEIIDLEADSDDDVQSHASNYSMPDHFDNGSNFPRATDGVTDGQVNGPAASPPRTTIEHSGLSAPTAFEMFPEHPEDVSMDEVANWKWEQLDEESARDKIVIKHLRELPHKVIQNLDEEMMNYNHKQLVILVRKALNSIRNRANTIVGVVAPSRLEVLFILARLWICWDSGLHRFRIGTIPEAQMKSAFETDDFPVFYQLVDRVLLADRNKGAHSDEEDEEDGVHAESNDALPKNRKRKVAKSRTAIIARSQAHERSRAGAVAETQLELDMQSGQLSTEVPAIVINASKAEDDQFIYLNPSISRQIKAHQIKVTIHEAATSEDERIWSQIPEPLRKSRTLVLCPAMLVDNWLEEFTKWMPVDCKSFGAVVALRSSSKEISRFATIDHWYQHGGALVMSYDMLLRLMKGKDEISERAKDQILQGPNIVVADEAHKMKNRGSKTSHFTREFRTRSRIALTGSPLANNLEDYYAMIEWIAPGYLGDEREFRDTYRQPIEAGLYADSSRTDQRRSLKRLRALKQEIDPKGDLTRKTEFVITTPLSEVQRKAYEAFIKIVTGAGDSRNVLFLNSMILLGLICNHPSTYHKRLSERIVEATSKAPTQTRTPPSFGDSEEDKEPPAPGHYVPTHVILPALESYQKILKEEQMHGEALTFPRLSAKMQIIQMILRESKKVGDQVLIFSHMLHTLSYLENMIGSMSDDITFKRIDGSSQPTGRLETIKAFNEGSHDVLLISTVAGSLGLNITGANRVILVDFGFNPSHEEQAVGRAYRIGQRKEVFVYHLVCGGTFEEKLHHVAIFKKQLSSRVVDHKNPERFAEKAREFFFMPRDPVSEPVDHFIGKDHVLDAILTGPLRNHVRSIQTAETLHAEMEEKLTEDEEKEVAEMMKMDKLRRTDPNAKYKAANVQITGVRSIPGHAVITGPPSSPLPESPTLERIEKDVLNATDSNTLLSVSATQESNGATFPMGHPSAIQSRFGLLGSHESGIPHTATTTILPGSAVPPSNGLTRSDLLQDDSGPAPIETLAMDHTEHNHPLDQSSIAGVPSPHISASLATDQVKSAFFDANNSMLPPRHTATLGRNASTPSPQLHKTPSMEESFFARDSLTTRAASHCDDSSEALLKADNPRNMPSQKTGTLISGDSASFSAAQMSSAISIQAEANQSLAEPGDKSLRVADGSGSPSKTWPSSDQRQQQPTFAAVNNRNIPGRPPLESHCDDSTLRDQPSPEAIDVDFQAPNLDSDTPSPIAKQITALRSPSEPLSVAQRLLENKGGQRRTETDRISSESVRAPSVVAKPRDNPGLLIKGSAGLANTSTRPSGNITHERNLTKPPASSVGSQIGHLEARITALNQERESRPPWIRQYQSQRVIDSPTVPHNRAVRSPTFKHRFEANSQMYPHEVNRQYTSKANLNARPKAYDRHAQNSVSHSVSQSPNDNIPRLQSNRLSVNEQDYVGDILRRPAREVNVHHPAEQRPPKSMHWRLDTPGAPTQTGRASPASSTKSSNASLVHPKTAAHEADMVLSARRAQVKSGTPFQPIDID